MQHLKRKRMFAKFRKRWRRRKNKVKDLKTAVAYNKTQRSTSLKDFMLIRCKIEFH